MVGHASEHHQLGQRLYHTGRPYAAGSPDRQTLSAVFVDDGQQPHSFALMEPRVHDFTGPHMVLPRRPQPHARAVIGPQTASLWPLHRRLQPFTSPCPLHRLVVHSPAAMPQKGGDSTVTVPAELTGQRHDLLGQRLLILHRARLESLCCGQSGTAIHQFGLAGLSQSKKR